MTRGFANGEYATTARQRIIFEYFLLMQFKKPMYKKRLIAATMARTISFCVLFASMGAQQAAAADATPPPTTHPKDISLAHQKVMPIPTQASEAIKASRPTKVTFNGESASQDTQQAANWVVDSGDNKQMPFIIIDKKDAKVFVFNADGKLQGAAPALLGLARGDDSVPGIGSRKLSSIRPEERTTPAGRFVASLGKNIRKKDILWVDYDLALSLHRVATSNIKERRAERLASPTPLDNRISYGCINVPVKFYETVVNPVFTGTNGIVYILPETKSMQEVFVSYK